MSTKVKIQARSRSEIAVSETPKRKRLSKLAKRSFQIYFQRNFETLKADNPRLKRKEILNDLKESWKSMTDEEKKEYSPLNNNEDNLNIGTKRKHCGSHKKDGEIKKAKRPLNAFGYYVKVNFEIFQKKNSNLSSTDLFKCMAEAWRNLDPEEKKMYFKHPESDSNRSHTRNIDKTAESPERPSADSKLKLSLSANNHSRCRQSILSCKANKLKCTFDNIGDNCIDANVKRAETSSSGCELRTNSSFTNSESKFRSPIYGDEISVDDGSDSKVKIFTESFIELSRLRESKLRDLRKKVNELERRNSILNDNLDHMQSIASACENFDQNKLKACLSWFETKNNKLLEIVMKYPFLSHNIDDSMSICDILENLSLYPKPLPNQLKKSLFECFSSS